LNITLTSFNADWFTTLAFWFINYYENTKQYDRDIVLCNKLLSMRIGSEYIYHFKLGEAYLKKNNKSAAKEQFTWVIKNPSNNEYFNNQAKKYLQTL
jgi:hypothetical protein